MAFVYPQYLVETGWLAEHLADPTIRVVDATVFLTARPEGGMARESGRAAYERGHIPGAVFVDLIEEISDTTAKFGFMMPPADQFGAAMSRLGIGNDTRVICYDGSSSMWGTRLWWMLRAFGHDNAAVLNGGWKKWTLEGRPVATGSSSYPPAVFTARPRPGLIADKAEVLAEMTNGGTCIINALSPQVHRGEAGAYTRRGRIPSSVNVPAGGTLDPATNALLPADQLRTAFDAVGATEKERVITYCGGGIAATLDAFILTLLGHQNVAVYDGSMTEWTSDPSMPLEVG